MNLRIKPKKRMNRAKPTPLSVPTSIDKVWSIDFMHDQLADGRAFRLFNVTIRYEWLAQYVFDSLEAVREFATRWMWSYNHQRPNMALGGITPKQRLAMAA